MMKRRLPILLSLLGLFAVFGWAEPQKEKKSSPRKERVQQNENRQSEEINKYFKKWIEEDVFHIIAPEEKDVFKKLTTVEEKEKFIEQFWLRRDPDPRTALNEFQEEHFRRIAYSNERYSSGKPGWMTDRGRIYIIHGPPSNIESHPSGGSYNREIHEGGGTTSTFPFEKWWYRHLDGVGDDIELEFVDPTMSGEYRLALSPDEKDALLFVPGAGLTLNEEMGLSKKEDRPFFNPGNRDNPGYVTRAKDQPFQRYETFVNVQRAPQIKFTDLQQMVNVNISYNSLSFKVRSDFVRLNERQVVVPVTVELQNSALKFNLTEDVQTATLNVYGLVKSLQGKIVAEFEDTIRADYPTVAFEQGRKSKSMYQKTLTLDAGTRYRLDLVVKDLNSGNVGVVSDVLVAPRYQAEELTSSSVILANFMRALPEIPKDNQMFVLGDLWIRPAVHARFSREDPLWVYLQIYNASVDQQTLQPSLEVRYEIRVGDRVIKAFEDSAGASVQFASGQRVVLTHQFGLSDVETGKYQVRIQIKDKTSGKTMTANSEFEVVTAS
ncbi:MAG: GWxTD domain-containing protein [Acidobacteriota bacterium]